MSRHWLCINKSSDDSADYYSKESQSVDQNSCYRVYLANTLFACPLKPGGGYWVPTYRTGLGSQHNLTLIWRPENVIGEQKTQHKTFKNQLSLSGLPMIKWEKEVLPREDMVWYLEPYSIISILDILLSGLHWLRCQASCRQLFGQQFDFVAIPAHQYKTKRSVLVVFRQIYCKHQPLVGL